MASSRVLSIESLQGLAGSLGLSVVGCAGLETWDEESKALEEWQKHGLAGQMDYLLRSPQGLCSPAKLCPAAESIVSVALFYESLPRPDCPAGFGKVARYAWGLDYHQVMAAKLKALVAACERFLETKLTAKVFCDAVPLLEKALGRHAGLGFIGKNSLLIRPGEGSFFVLGDILWDVEIEQDLNRVAFASGWENKCGACRRCRDFCPAGALVDDYVLDARKCISYLTIEKKGALSWDERAQIGEWVFGCDVCQEVCPFNYAPLKKGRRAGLQALAQQSGVGMVLDLGTLLKIRSAQDFSRRFGKTSLMRPKRSGLLRNAAVVAANTHASQVAPALYEAAEGDSSGLVRQHALWALYRLTDCDGGLPKTRLKAILEKHLADPDEGVVQETKSILALI